MCPVDRSFIPSHLDWQLMDASVCTGIRSLNVTMQSRNYDFFGESPPNCAGDSYALLSKVTALR